MNKAKSAKTAEELLPLAKESGIEMTADEAAKYFAELNKQGELSDDELTSVAGGGKGDDETMPDPEYSENTPLYQGSNDIVFVYRISAAYYDSAEKCYFYDIVRRNKGGAGETDAYSHVTAQFISSNFRTSAYEYNY